MMRGKSKYRIDDCRVFPRDARALTQLLRGPMTQTELLGGCTGARNKAIARMLMHSLIEVAALHPQPLGGPPVRLFRITDKGRAILRRLQPAMAEAAALRLPSSVFDLGLLAAIGERKGT